MTNREKFRAAYLEKLTAAHAKYPEEYAYPAEQVPFIVDKITATLATTGGANIGPAIKAVCRKLGIKSTYGAIKEYLNA